MNIYYIHDREYTETIIVTISNRIVRISIDMCGSKFEGIDRMGEKVGDRETTRRIEVCMIYDADVQVMLYSVRDSVEDWIICVLTYSRRTIQ